MKQQRSPDKPGSEGYQRICADCGADMGWEWGGPQAYFACRGCGRIEPTTTIILERSKGTLTLQTGNREEVFAFSPDEWKQVLAIALGKKD